MTIRIRCENGHLLLIREQLAGQIRCPKCHASVTVPAPADSDAEILLDELVEEPSDRVRDAVLDRIDPVGTRHSAGKRKSLLMVVVAGLLSLPMLGGAGLWAIFAGWQQPPPTIPLTDQNDGEKAMRQGERVNNPNIGFTLDLPPGFTPRPDLVGAVPNIDAVHAFEYKGIKAGEPSPLLVIDNMHGTIGRESLAEVASRRPDFQGSIVTVAWQGFDLEGIRTTSRKGNQESINYAVQIPLRRSAVQVLLSGPSHRADVLQPLLHKVVAGVQGESNWAAPRRSAVARDQVSGLFALFAGLLGVLISGVILWFVSRAAFREDVLGGSGTREERRQGLLLMCGAAGMVCMLALSGAGVWMVIKPAPPAVSRRATESAAPRRASHKAADRI